MFLPDDTMMSPIHTELYEGIARDAKEQGKAAVMHLLAVSTEKEAPGKG